MGQNKNPGLFYGYVLVILTFFILLIQFGASYSFGVFFQPIITEFGWSRALFTGAASLGSVLGAPLGVVWGKINDRFGPRAVLSFVGISTVIAYLMMAQMSQVWQLYLYRGVIWAIGGAGLMVSLLPTLSRWFVKRRGMMTGLALTGIGVGTMIMSPASDWLIARYDWRNTLIITGIVCSVVVLFAQFLKRDPARMGLQPYGAAEVKKDKPDVQFKGFTLQEAIHTRQLWLLCVIYFGFLFAVQTIYQHIVIHAIDLGVSSAGAAAVLSTIGGSNIFGRFLGGVAGDRFGNRKVILIAFIVLLADFTWLLAASEFWMLGTFAVVFGLAYGSIYTLEVPTIAEMFGEKALSSIVGVVNFAYISGIAVGPFLAGYIFDVTGSYQIAFYICIGVLAAALTATILLTPTTAKKAVTAAV